MKVIWNLTRLCSWNCLICCISAIHVRRSQKNDVHAKLIEYKKELTLDEKKRIAYDLYENDIDSIDLSGGDLLLDDDNIHLIKYMATMFLKDKLSISIPGNGLHRVIHDIKDCIGKIEFTLDEISEIKDGARPSGYARCAMNGIKLCNPKQMKVCVSTVLKRGNCSKKILDGIYQFLIKNNVHEWEILPYYQVGRAIDIYGLRPNNTQLNNAIEYLQGKISENVINISFQHCLENYVTGSFCCNAATRSIGLLADGTVTACAWALGYDGMPVEDSLVLGKLPNQRLKDILKSKKILIFIRNKNLNHQCLCNTIVQEDRAMVTNIGSHYQMDIFPRQGKELAAR